MHNTQNHAIKTGIGKLECEFLGRVPISQTPKDATDESRRTWGNESIMKELDEIKIEAEQRSRT